MPSRSYGDIEACAMGYCENYIAVVQPLTLEPYLKTSSVKDYRTTKLAGQSTSSSQIFLPCIRSPHSSGKERLSIELLAKKICLASVGDGAYHFELRGNVVSSAETLA